MNWKHILTVIVFSALPLIAAAEDQENRTLAETGSAHYRFERLNLDSTDGQRHYRLDIGIPRNPPAPAG
ncbi:MAG TPA: alpha/beta hydrolase, partial [Pseudomonas sp.]|nr:alpha/beta hydrolase [Pseudomonas sp.]